MLGGSGFSVVWPRTFPLISFMDLTKCVHLLLLVFLSFLRFHGGPACDGFFSTGVGPNLLFYFILASLILDVVFSVGVCYGFRIHSFAIHGKRSCSTVCLTQPLPEVISGIKVILTCRFMKFLLLSFGGVSSLC
ncbi:hypothetical protein Bca4012_074297 [Brassica carinata]